MREGGKSKDRSQPENIIHVFAMVLKMCIRDRYMRGIYENPSLFNGHIFSYDESAYAVEISTTLKEKSDTGNMLTLHLSMYAKGNGGLLLAEFDKIFTGFKPLSELKNELIAYSTPDLHEFVKNKLDVYKRQLLVIKST